MANVHINNLEVGKIYEITHRVHAGAPKRGQFIELIEPSAGFVNRRAKFTMLDMPVAPAPTRSFQPENWKFTEEAPAAPAAPGAPAAPAAAQQQAGRRRKTRRASHKKRRSTHTRRRRSHN